VTRILHSYISRLHHFLISVYLSPRILPPHPPPISTHIPYTTLFRSDMQKGDVAAREKLICHNMRLVAHIAKKYGKGNDLDDLIRSEEHTSELQSRFDIVCRLLLE